MRIGPLCKTSAVCAPEGAGGALFKEVLVSLSSPASVGQDHLLDNNEMWVRSVGCKAEAVGKALSEGVLLSPKKRAATDCDPSMLFRTPFPVWCLLQSFMGLVATSRCQRLFGCVRAIIDLEIL